MFLILELFYQYFQIRKPLGAPQFLCIVGQQCAVQQQQTQNSYHASAPVLAVARDIKFLACPSVRPIVVIAISHKHLDENSSNFKDELSRFLWSKVKVTVTY